MNIDKNTKNKQTRTSQTSSPNKTASTRTTQSAKTTTSNKSTTKVGTKLNGNQQLSSSDSVKVNTQTTNTSTDIYQKLLKAKDDNAIKALISTIDTPETLTEINNLLAKNKTYKSDDLYSPIEKFLYKNMDASSITNYSFGYLEKVTQNWIAKGILKGEDAINAQARLASRIIFDGADGFGTNEDVVDKGVRLIKSPVRTANVEQNKKNAKLVKAKVDSIIKNHKTFYGIGKKFDNLESYLGDDLSTGEFKYEEMQMKVNGVKKSTFSKEDIPKLIAKYSKTESGKLKVSVIQDMAEKLLGSIQDLSDSGIENGGMFADMADWLSGLWNNKSSFTMYVNTGTDLNPKMTPVQIKGNPHGNRSNLVKDDIIECYNNIKELVQGLQDNTFEAKFKKIFQVDYNENNIKEYNKASDIANMAIETEAQLNYIEQAHKNMSGKEYRETLAKFLNFSEDDKKQLKEMAFATGVTEDSVYKYIASNMVSKAKNNLKQMTGGKTPEQLYNKAQKSREKAFGKTSISANIDDRVSKYNQSQISGAITCQVLTEVLALAAIMILSGGTLSAPVIGELSTAMSYGIASGTTHFTAEMLNKFTSAEGNTWEHTGKSLRDSVIDATFSYVSEGMANKLLNVIGGTKFIENHAVLKSLYKPISSGIKDATLETGREFTKSMISNKEATNFKGIVKGLYAVIIKVFLKKLGIGGVSGKFLADKGTKKLLTNETCYTLNGKFDIKDFDFDAFKKECNNNPELKEIVKNLSDKELKDLVNEILPELEPIMTSTMDLNKTWNNNIYFNMLQKQNAADSTSQKKNQFIPNWNSY